MEPVRSMVIFKLLKCRKLWLPPAKNVGSFDDLVLIIMTSSINLNGIPIYISL